jgi:isopenicillin N synthase-like dioxygenase
MGYSALLSGNNDPNNKGDLQEGFEFGWEDIDSVPSNTGGGKILGGKNVWPSKVPEFRVAALEY